MSEPTQAPTAELLEAWDRRYYLHEHVTPEEYRFVHVIAAEGMEFTLGDGTRMLDFASQTVCCNLGHRHPRVVDAIKDALDRYGHLTAYPRLGNHYKPVLAELLVDELLGPDDWAGRVRFLSSGSEAVDQAMLIARLYTQRPIIVAFQHAFHGSTLGASGIGNRFRGYAGGLSSPEDPTFLRRFPATRWTAAPSYLPRTASAARSGTRTRRAPQCSRAVRCRASTQLRS